MMQQLFQAMVVREEPGNIFLREIKEKNISELPDHDVLIAVHFSSLNHKDALSASGNKGVTRRYPHTPGVDAAGIVMESRSEKFKAGDEVIVTGFEPGTKMPGGFGQFIRVPAEWIVPLPHGMSLYESMIYGTAGFTAAQSASCALSLRQRIWNKLAAEWKINQLHDLARVVDLHHLNNEIDSILKGKIKGRIVVQL